MKPLNHETCCFPIFGIYLSGFSMLGRTEDALVLRYKQILRKMGNLQFLLRDMEHFYKAECQPPDGGVGELINQHIVLLGKLHLKHAIIFYVTTELPFKSKYLILFDKKRPSRENQRNQRRQL